MSKATFTTCRGGYLGAHESTKSEPMKKPDFEVITEMIRDIIIAQTNLKYSYQFLEATKDGKVLFSKCLNNGEEITFQASWEYTDYGVTVDFIHAAPIVKINKNYNMKNMKNFEEEALTNSAIVEVTPDETNDYSIVDYDETEVSDEEVLLPNSSFDLPQRKFADENSEEIEPLAFNGSNLK